MVALLPPAELQFADANGVPYAAGTLATYIPGTSTPSPTWSESTGTALNTNPIVLDAAGRCILYGSGIYRTVLKDAAGNLIWDQLTNSLVSSAMAPVMLAVDIPTAQLLLGITPNDGALWAAAIAAETARALAAEALLLSGRNTDIGNLNAAVAGETARAKAAEAALAASIPAASTLQSGLSGGTDAGGHVRVNFPTPFANRCTSVVTSISGAGLNEYAVTASADRLGVDFWAAYAYGKAGVGIGIYWLATGN